MLKIGAEMSWKTAFDCSLRTLSTDTVLVAGFLYAAVVCLLVLFILFSSAVLRN